jgi:S-formylglutathione hydrolase FrmB
VGGPLAIAVRAVSRLSFVDVRRGAHDRFRRGDHARICVEAGFCTEWKVADREGAVPQRETFHVVELLSLLEREYAGLSMGGYGALRYAIRHPGLLLGVASLSELVHPHNRPRHGEPARLAGLA